jgi:hypothetical protein
MAMKNVFGKMGEEEKKKVETKAVVQAIDEYNSLIFDVRRETIDSYKKKIVKLQRESLQEDVSFGKLKEIDAAIKFLQGRIEEIQQELSIEEKVEYSVRGDKRLSFVEKWQLNQKRKREQQSF